MRKYRTPFNARFLRSILNYDAATGVWTWNVDDRFKHRKKGARAGCLTKSGYWKIGIDRTNYASSRLAFLWMTGHWPKKDVDHKDGNSANDRWNNLRQATNAQNMWNRKEGKKPKGAFFVNGRWRAIIGYRRRTISLGTYDTAEAAHAAYMKKAKKLYGEFARAR